MYKLIDLTHTIVDGLPVYPGDAETKLNQTKYLNKDKHNNHQLEISMHAGTHIDSPMHFLETEKYICELPLEAFMGEGCLLDVQGEIEIGVRPEYDSMVRENSIVLLHTGWSAFFGQERYSKSHPVLTMDFAQFLIDKRVKIVGMDMISPDRFPFEIHKKLFANNVLIIENLTNLEQLKQLQRFEVMAFPLKVRADASILRVVAREIEK